MEVIMKKIISLVLVVLLFATLAMPLTAAAAGVTLDNITATPVVGGYLTLTGITVDGASSGSVYYTVTSSAGYGSYGGYVSFYGGTVSNIPVNYTGSMTVTLSANGGTASRSFTAVGTAVRVLSYVSLSGSSMSFSSTSYVYFANTQILASKLAPSGYTVSSVDYNGRTYQSYEYIPVSGANVSIPLVRLNTGTNYTGYTGAGITVPLGTAMTITDAMVGVSLSTGQFSLISSNSGVATITNNVITGVSYGSCLIYVVNKYSTSQIVNTIPVTVGYGTNANYGTGGVIVGDSIFMTPGSTMSIVNVFPGLYPDPAIYSITTDNSSIASTTSNFALYAATLGTTTLKLTHLQSGRIVGSKTVYVMNQIPATSPTPTPSGTISTNSSVGLYIGPESFDVARNKYYTFNKVKVNGVYVKNADLNWKSSNTKYVTVDKKGKFRGKVRGESAIITATTKDGEYKATIVINVE